MSVSASGRPGATVLEAVLERWTYLNEETGYAVARVSSAWSSDLLTVVGPLQGAQPGESLRLVGRRDVQVLTPMHRGPAGAGALNGLLQQRLTPARDGAPERRAGGRAFRVGDKVSQIRNNYDKGRAGVFNGTVGVVTALSTEDQTLTVRTDEDELVDYGFDELDELVHAYDPLCRVWFRSRGATGREPADH